MFTFCCEPLVGSPGGETAPTYPRFLLNTVCPADLPFAPFGKGDLGKGFRAADFTTSAFPRYQKRSYRSDEPVVNEELQYKHDATEDQTFSLVDTSKTGSKKGGFGGQRRSWGGGKGGKGGRGGWGKGNKQPGGVGMKDFGGIPGSKGGRGAQQAQRKRNDPRGNAFRARGKGKGKGKGGRFGNRVDRQASVKV